MLNPTVDFIAGTVAGMAGLVVGFPFDTVKVRFQSPQIAHKYHSTLHAVTTIVREERVVGLYKGIASPLATVALMNGLVFAAYKFLLRLQLATSDAVPTLTQIALAGAGSGIFSAIVTTPVELIKIRQQEAIATRPSTLDVARDLVRAGGLRGLYRGAQVTALRDCGYGAYFAAYEASCRLFTPRDATAGPSWVVLMVSGGIAGVAGWVATFPLDVVKTRIQGNPPAPTLASNSPLLTKPALNPYRDMSSTIVHSYRTEGAPVFFRGLAPTLIRAVPVNMITFAAFEAVVHAAS